MPQINHRAEAWRAWMAGVRSQLLALDPHATVDGAPLDRSAMKFFSWHYAAHSPTTLQVGPWPAMDWTLEALEQRMHATPVQVQTNRESDPDFEFYSSRHRETIPFDELISRIRAENSNDTYLTANNFEDAATKTLLKPLFADIGPLPSFLTQDPASGFLWLGGKTMTPLHFDQTQNCIVQVMGEKLVRLVSPVDIGRVDMRGGVHSNIGWLSFQEAEKRSIPYADVTLKPGVALFVPVGWMHCVKAMGPSATITFTNFRWTNSWPNGPY